MTRNNSVIPHDKLEEFVRIDLNKSSRRLFAVYKPLAFEIKGWTGVLCSF